MRFDKLTTKFQQAFADAQSMAVAGDHSSIEAVHLLSALLQDDGSTTSLLAQAGVNITPLKTDLAAAIDALPTVSNHEGEVTVSRELNKTLNLTDKRALDQNDTYIASELFLLTLADSKETAGKLLKKHGLKKATLELAVAQVRGGENVNSQDGESNREALKKYTLDLTERAQMGKLDPVIGRDDEIRRARFIKKQKSLVTRYGIAISGR